MKAEKGLIPKYDPERFHRYGEIYWAGFQITLGLLNANFFNITDRRLPGGIRQFSDSAF